MYLCDENEHYINFAAWLAAVEYYGSYECKRCHVLVQIPLGLRKRVFCAHSLVIPYIIIGLILCRTSLWLGFSAVALYGVTYLLYMYILWAARMRRHI